MLSTLLSLSGLVIVFLKKKCLRWINCLCLFASGGRDEPATFLLFDNLFSFFVAYFRQVDVLISIAGIVWHFRFLLGLCAVNDFVFEADVAATQAETQNPWIILNGSYIIHCIFSMGCARLARNMQFNFIFLFAVNLFKWRFQGVLLLHLLFAM